MKCWKRCITALGLSLSAAAGTAQAEDPQAATGFHGDLMIGGMWSSTDSRLAAGDTNHRIDSLDDDGKTESEWNPMAMGSLSYTTSFGTRFFLTGDGGFSAGFGQELEGIGSVSLAAVYQQGEIWKDPYLTGVDREETDEVRLGGRVNLEHIMGTGFNFGYVLTDVAVDNDAIGKKERLLQREGTVHNVTAGYDVPLGESNTLTPQVQYEAGDLDGASNSYDKWGGGLTHTFTNDFLLVTTTVSAGKAEYDHRHPVFDKTRDEATYGISSTVSWLNPLGFTDFVASATVSCARTDANIDFFDSTDTMFGLGLGYRF